jgi:hypothetical protein
MPQALRNRSPTAEAPRTAATTAKKKPGGPAGPPAKDFELEARYSAPTPR